MIMFIKYKQEKDYVSFKENIIQNTKVMPQVFSNYGRGWYSKVHKNTISIMYAHNNSYDVIPPPLRCKLYGIFISFNKKIYLLGVITIEFWILLAIVFGILDAIFHYEVFGTLIILAGFIAIILCKYQEIKKIKQFILINLP